MTILTKAARYLLWNYTSKIGFAGHLIKNQSMSEVPNRVVHRNGVELAPNVSRNSWKLWLTQREFQTICEDPSYILVF